jgi:hypothetical protein
MAILDLGTLRVGVEAAGVDSANSRLGDFNKKVSEAEQGSNSASKGIKSLSSSFKEGLANTTLFGSRLGDLKTQLAGGTGASSLLQGAVMGLTTSFVNLAIQGIQSAVAALGRFAADSINVASDLQENMNVVNTVFGEENSIVEWAKDSAGAFNLSANEAQKFAGIMGAVLTPSNLGKESIEQMSMTLAQLSGDLGSLWNKSSEEAFNALRSAITGETEPMKNFGVVMTQTNLEAFALAQGIDKTWQAMTQAEQATLRYNYILENTKTAQGDVAKTTDSYANSSKQLTLAIENAKNALGAGFLPALAKIKQSMAEFVSNNQETIRFFSNILGMGLQSIAAGLELLSKPLNFVLSVINKIASLINPVIEKFRDVMTDVTSKVLNGAKAMASGVEYAMLDTAEVTRDAMGEASKSVADSMKEMEDKATVALGNVKSALDEYYDKERREYKKKLEQQYGDSKTAAIKIAEIMTRYDEEANRKKERDMEVYTRNHEAKYNQDYQNYASYEQRKTQVATEEAKKREELIDEYVERLKRASVFQMPSIIKDAQKDGVIDFPLFPFGSSKNRYANGTLNAQAGWAVVGETGRELMYVGGGSKIINNNTTEKILQGGGGNTFTGNTINITPNNFEDFIEQMEMAHRSGVFK